MGLERTKKEKEKRTSERNKKGKEKTMMTFNRPLNSYEAMLERATCTVGVRLSGQLDKNEISASWARTQQKYPVLCATIQIPKEEPQKEMKGGGLSQISLCGGSPQPPLFWPCGDENQNDKNNQIGERLQDRVLRIGQSALNTRERCAELHVWPEENTVVLLCTHAVSDAPSVLFVLQELLRKSESDSESGAAAQAEGQLDLEKQLCDPQPLLLAKRRFPTTGEPYPHLDVVRAELASVSQSQSSSKSKETSESKETKESEHVLLPEALQNLPADDASKFDLGCIHAEFASLSDTETSALVDACRRTKCTVQGLLSAATLVTRLAILGKSEQILVPILIPVNTRRELDNDFAEACICGSAGAWLALRVESSSAKNSFASLAAQISSNLRQAVEQGQHLEWLHRMASNIATVPPYSIMASSVGSFHFDRDIEEGFFLGAAQSSKESLPAKGTMVHIVTFNGKMSIASNVTAPGISKALAQRNLTALLAISNAFVANSELSISQARELCSSKIEN